jgi:uncharacterized membrane protein YfcA
MDFLTGYQYLAIGLGLLGASVLHSTIGFGSAAFALPIMLMAGLTLPAAITVNLVAAVVLNLTGSIHLRRDIDWSTTVRPIMLRLLALPVGLVLLVYADHVFDPQLVKQIVGALLLLILAVHWFWRIEPQDRLHPGWEFLAFGCSGTLMGFCGMGGPPMVLWVMAQRWPAARSRAFFFVVFASGMVPHAILLGWLFGADFAAAAVAGIACVPVVIVGTFIGLRLGQQLPRRALRRIALIILTGIALSALLSPLVG